MVPPSGDPHVSNDGILLGISFLIEMYVLHFNQFLLMESNRVKGRMQKHERNANSLCI